MNYAGRPLTISSLFPDNGLANLAACLLGEDNEVRILDYSTVDTIKRLRFPEKENRLLNELGKKITTDLQQGKELNDDDVKELHSLEARLDTFQQERTLDIAKEIVDFAGEWGPDFVGLKLWNGDGFTGSLMIAEELKKAYPDLPIFAGGPHADWFKELILEETRDIDVLSYGDGEETINLLVKYAKGKIKLEEIPGIIYRENGDIKRNPLKWIENLDELPLPVYDAEIYPAMKGNNKVKIITFDESRGCPYSCAFCIHPDKSGNRWRVKSKERVTHEIEYFIDNYDSNVFVFAGSTTPPKLLHEIAKKILKEGLEVEYAIFGNFKNTNPGDYKSFEESGCRAIFFGLESGSEYILERAMNKKVSPDRIKNALKSAKKSGIYTIASVIYPAPFETEETKKATLDLILETKPDSVPVQFPGLIPGSQWTNNPEKFNFEFADIGAYCKTLIHYKVKLSFPPLLWDSLPYKCNGKDFLTLVKESTEFIQELEYNGILTSISQDLALALKKLNMDHWTFRDLHRTSFLTGDYQTIADLAKSINQNIKNRK